MGERPKVGVGVIIRKGDHVLLGKRKGSHGEGCWQFPGGHLEFGEDPIACAKREILEEIGPVHLSNIRTVTFTNDIFEEHGKHYITLFVMGDFVEGEPHVMEPEKCDCWEWHPWENLPRPLFLPIENLLKQGFRP